MKKFFRNTRAQASLEYIFMLATAAMAALLLFNVFLKPATRRLMTYMENRFDRVIGSGDLHTLPFRQN